jgi:hypothetical protein
MTPFKPAKPTLPAFDRSQMTPLPQATVEPAPLGTPTQMTPEMFREIRTGGTTAPTPQAPVVAPPSYNQQVVGQLNEQFATPTTAADQPDEVTRMRTEMDTYKTEMDSAFQKLQNLKTQTFNDEFEKRKLGAVKQKIVDKDSEIGEARRQRDEALNAVRGNRNMSSAMMRGEAKRIADFADANINNLINERNSIAQEYNSGLAEIEGEVSRATSDIETEYKHYADLMTRAQQQAADYQKMLREDLKRTQDQDNWERQLAQQLQIAQMRGSGGEGSPTRLTLVTDKFSGLPAGTFNPITGQYEPYQGDGGSANLPIEEKIRNRFSTNELQNMAKAAGYKSGGFMGIGGTGDVTSYLNAIKAGTVPSPI